MKIEMAPWAKAYTVDMIDMYTELTLGEIKNKPAGPINSKISNYKDLFRENPDPGKHQKDNNRKESKIPTIKKDNNKAPIAINKIKTEIKEKRERNRMLLKQSKIPIPSKTVTKSISRHKGCVSHE